MKFVHTGPPAGHCHQETRSGTTNQQPSETMLHWTLVFLVIAIIAAILGFGGLAGTAAGIAKILFLIFLVIWIVSLVTRK